MPVPIDVKALLDAGGLKAVAGALQNYADQLGPAFDSAVEHQVKLRTSPELNPPKRSHPFLSALGLTALAVPAVYGGYRFFKDHQGQPEEPQIEPVKAAHLVKRAEPVGSLPPRPLSPDEIRYGVSR